MKLKYVKGLKILSKTSSVSEVTSSETVVPPIQMLLRVKTKGLCCAYECPNGYNARKCPKFKIPPEDFVDKPGYHIMFPIPRNKGRLEQWVYHIQKRHKVNVEFRSTDTICSTHFRSCDMFQKPYTSLVENNGKQEIHTQYFTYLKPEALPVYFKKPVIAKSKTVKKTKKKRKTVTSYDAGDDATYEVTPTGSPVRVTTLDAGSPIPLPQNEDELFASDIMNSSAQLVEQATANNECTSAPFKIPSSEAKSSNIEDILSIGTSPSTCTKTTREDILSIGTSPSTCTKTTREDILSIGTSPSTCTKTTREDILSIGTSPSTCTKTTREDILSIGTSPSTCTKTTREDILSIGTSPTTSKTEKSAVNDMCDNDGDIFMRIEEIETPPMFRPPIEFRTSSKKNMTVNSQLLQVSRKKHPRSLSSSTNLVNQPKNEIMMVEKPYCRIPLNKAKKKDTLDTDDINIEFDPHLLFTELLEKYETIKLPSKQWASHVCVNKKFVAFSYMDVNPSGALSEKKIVFTDDMKPKIWLDGIYKDTFIFENIKHFQDIVNMIDICNNMDHCPGTSNPSQPFSSDCGIYKHIRTNRCKACVYKRRMLYSRDKHRALLQKNIASEIANNSDKERCASEIAKQLDVTKKSQRLLTSIMTAANEALLFQQQEIFKVITPILSNHEAN